VQLYGGDVIDWLTDEDVAVLMTRNYVPETSFATEYISEGRGTVRIFAHKENRSDRMDTGVIGYMYRQPGSREWHKLSVYDTVQHTGFRPLAIYSVTLDDSLQEKLIYAHPEVDVHGLVRIGRRQHVVGVAYNTDRPHTEIFVPEIAQLLLSLSTALPEHPMVRIADSSTDESKLLIFAHSDTDPGVYYLFDRKTHALSPLLAAREPLVGVNEWSGWSNYKLQSDFIGDGPEIHAGSPQRFGTWGRSIQERTSLSGAACCTAERCFDTSKAAIR
jgi:hypothetical protein